MTTRVSGTTGVDQVQDNAISTAKMQNVSVTPAKLSGGQSGSAPVYGARAWCVFNGTTAGTNAPLAGGNVTSVTRNGAGDYTINFTTAMQDALYAVTGVVTAAGGASYLTIEGSGSALTTTTARVVVTTGSTNVDRSFVCVSIFR